MKKILVCFMVLLSGCVVETESTNTSGGTSETPVLDCYICKNGLFGIDLSQVNACKGAVEAFGIISKDACDHGSMCVSSCITNLCDGKEMDSGCKSCLIVNYKKDYLACDMIGIE